MNGISPTDELLNKAFQLAYFILGDRTTSIYVAMAAIDKLKTASTIQDRRLYYMPKGRSTYPASRTKVSLSQIHLLQRLVYTEAEPFERLIEGQGRSLQQQDMIIRFIKHLVRITTKHNSFYVVLGLCRVLHNYTTSEAAEIYNFLIQDPDRGRDDYYYRSRKKHLMAELRERFGASLKTARGFRGEERFEPQEDSAQYLKLIRECLIRFTPWESLCVLPPDIDPTKTTVASLLFKGKDPDDEHEIELNRIHTLLDPDCFARLALALGFDAPNQRLEVPYFFISSDAGSATEDRLKPEALSEGELQAIRRYLDKNAAYRRQTPNRFLSVLVDGYEQTRFEVDRTGGVQFNVEEGSELIEVRSLEPDDQVTIALQPISRNETGIVSITTRIKLGAWRSLSLRIQPRDDASNGTAGALVELRHHESSPLSLVSSWLQKPVAWLGAISHGDGARFNHARIVFACLLLTICLVGFVALLRSRMSSPLPQPVVENNGAAQQRTPESQASERASATTPAQTDVERHPGASQTTPPNNQLAQKQTPGSGSAADDDLTRGRPQSPTAATLTQVKRVYVDQLGDDNLGRQISEELRKKLSSSGRFEVVEKRADADAVFKGLVKRVSRPTGKGSIALRLVNARGEVIWSTRAAHSGHESEIAEKLLKDLLAAIAKPERKR